MRADACSDLPFKVSEYKKNKKKKKRKQKKENK